MFDLLYTPKSYSKRPESSARHVPPLTRYIGHAEKLNAGGLSYAILDYGRVFLTLYKNPMFLISQCGVEYTQKNRLSQAILCDSTTTHIVGAEVCELSH